MVNVNLFGFGNRFGGQVFIRGRNELSARSYDKRSTARDNGSTGRSLLYVFIAVIAVSWGLAVPHLIPESVAYKTAEGLGYTNVKVVNRQFLFVQLTGCGRDDSVQFTVSGTNPNGDQQQFDVCAGLFKGGTPRF